MDAKMEDLVRELKETPESATQNLAFLIGFVHNRLNKEQYKCAIASLRVLARRAGVPEEVVEAALR